MFPVHGVGTTDLDITRDRNDIPLFTGPGYD
jgi:hypothetical protein